VETKPNDCLTVNETFLLVDDEEPLLDVMCDMLDWHGYTAITAGSGEAAIEIYKKKRDRIDLVLLDVGMPGIGGRRCLEELLRINPKIKVIIATGYPASGKVKKMIDTGAAGFIGKPYRLADLLKKAKEILDKDKNAFN